MRKALRVGSLALLILVVAFLASLGYLATTAAQPRTSQGWTRLADMPVARGEAASTAVDLCTPEVVPCPLGEQVLVMGGIGGLGRTSRDVFRYAPDTNVWHRAPSLPGRRHHAAAASISGVVYVSGGARRSERWRGQQTFWSLQPDATSWQSLPRMPEPRLGHAMVAVGGRLFIIGGRGATGHVLIYEPDGAFWRTGAVMPRPRDHLAAVVVGSNIWAIGGRDSEVTNRVDIYDTLTNRWSPGPPLPAPMSAMGAGLLADGIHVVGGEDPSTFGGHVIDRHYVLNPSLRRWQTAPRPILPVHGAAAVVLRGNLVLAGGARRQGTLSVLGWTGLMQAYEPTLQ